MMSYEQTTKAGGHAPLGILPTLDAQTCNHQWVLVNVVTDHLGRERSHIYRYKKCGETKTVTP